MTYTTIAIIYNPNSTGSSKKLAEQFKSDIKTRLASQKIELIATTHAGHAEELAYKISKASKHPLIISSSGDGGYHEVVNGAMKAQSKGARPTTGILPAGNANDHYHNLHSEDTVEAIVKGNTQTIDLLKLSSSSKGKPFERYGHSYIGFGVSPKIGDELNKQKLNPINEIGIVAKTLFAPTSIKATIGNETHTYDSLIFSNVERMSKVLKVSQSSHITDGKFEVSIFRKRNKLGLIKLLLRASLTGIKEDRTAKKFSFKTVNDSLVQIDGEIFSVDAHSTVLIESEKQVLTCIV